MTLNRILLFLLFLLTISVNAQTVYITKTGEKYHTENCSYLSQSKIAIDFDKAKNYHTPCSRCKPIGYNNRSNNFQSNGSNNTHVAVQCSDKTQSGARCKRTTTNANGRCYQH